MQIYFSNLNSIQKFNYLFIKLFKRLIRNKLRNYQIEPHAYLKQKNYAKEEQIYSLDDEKF